MLAGGGVAFVVLMIGGLIGVHLYVRPLDQIGASVVGRILG
jgi:hypothetical protein